MKARVLSLLLAGAVMTGLLTGCGGAENVEASGETGNGYQDRTGHGSEWNGHSD